MDNEQYDGETAQRQRRELTDEERELQRQRKVKRNAISILRGISIRMPLLIYGANVDFDEDFTIDMFLNKKIVDDDSWAEFMPAGVTREFFQGFMQYYDEDVFVAAGRRVRNLAKAADEFTPTERVKKIAELFSTFKNPDKETVLTPWRVVNLHMTEVFGGYDFFAEDNPPQFVPTEIFRADKKILEINSKTGLYPLFVAYSIYRDRLGNVSEAEKNLADLQKIWDKTVAENVFVICKTPMAKTITRRTLLGYRGGNVNAHCFDDLINTLKNKPKQFVDRVTNKNFWNKGSGKMFFDAVVGNPPYQNLSGGTGKFNSTVYNLFVETSFQLAEKVSLIHPARCLFNAGAATGDFNGKLLQDEHFKIIRYEADSKKFFPTSDIEGGIVITLRDAKQKFGAIGTFTPFEELNSIHQRVCVNNKNFRPLKEIVFSQTIHRLTKKFHADNPDAVNKISKGHANDFSTVLMNRFRNLFFDTPPADGHEYVQIYGRQDNERVCKYFRSDWVTHPAPFEKFKVLVPTANGSGAIGEFDSTPLIGTPFVSESNVGNTETYVTIGAFDTRDEAEACLKYIKTKFARAMLGILKVTQHNPPSKWAKVPLQNFTASSDIDWTKSVAQIDAELYRKYGLTDAEKNFIETHVKEMT